MAPTKPGSAATDRWQTNLTLIEPNRILIRGYPLDEMMGRISFGEAIYLLLTGELPSPSIGRLVEAMLVSFVDHGATPPSTLVARNAATTGASLRGAVAAGVLGFGRHHGGDILACRQVLDEGLALGRAGRSMAEAAAALADRLVDADEPRLWRLEEFKEPRARLRAGQAHDQREVGYAASANPPGA